MNNPMNEISQETIRGIAQNLLAQARGGAPLPEMTSPDLPNAQSFSFPSPDYSAGIPSGVSPMVDPFTQGWVPPGNGLPLSGGTPLAIPAELSLPQVNIPAVPLSLSNSQMPTESGIKAFAQQIRESKFQAGMGPCGAASSDLDRVRGLFQGIQNSGSSRPFDVAAIRRDFPILNQKIHGKQLVWLDNAATTQKPQRVIDALSHYYAHDNSNIHRAAHTLAARSTDAYELARQRIQRFLGAASVEEVIFVRGTTEGINLVANTFGKKFLKPGDEILLSVLEHHANIVPWQMIARETGAVIRVIPVNDRGEIMMSEYQALLGPRTKLVSITHASNSLGTILPIEEMTHLAKRHGAKVLIDGAQSVAHIPVNFQKLDCDFFVFSGHKIFGPTGIGAVLIKKDLQELLPPWQGGGNMIKRVTFEETTYSEPPAKFEAGTPNIADAVGLGEALEYVSRLGLPNISKYEHELLLYGTEKLSRVPGLRLIGTAPEKVGVLSFVIKDRRPQDIGKLLDLEGIAVRAGHHCAQPSLRRFGLEETVRPSLSFYNTREELDRLYEALAFLQRSSVRTF